MIKEDLYVMDNKVTMKICILQNYHVYTVPIHVHAQYVVIYSLSCVIGALMCIWSIIYLTEGPQFHQFNLNHTHTNTHTNTHTHNTHTHNKIYKLMHDEHHIIIFQILCT